MRAGRVPRAGIPAAVFLVIGLAAMPAAHAASPPVGMPGVNVTGTVHAAVVAGDLLVIGGDFTTGAGGSNLAAIGLTADPGLAVIEWVADLDAPVHALVASPNGAVIYVGGEFTQIGDEMRTRLAAVTRADGTVTAWNPGADGPVYALARSGDGLTLYAGGEFTQIGSAPRAHLASLSTVIPNGAAGEETGGALPWIPEPNGPVRALALDEAAGRIYAGGSFTGIGAGAASSRNGLAALNVASAAALDWDPALDGGAEVEALAVGDGVLYTGGTFSAGGRANLAAFDTVTGAVTAWDAGADGAVRALALLSDGARLYAGGAFTFMDDAGGDPVARARIAGFIFDGDAGTLMPWNPVADDDVLALAAGSGDAFLFAGGAFEAGVAAFAVAPPETFLEPPGGSFDAPQSVTLACEDRSGAGCLRICYAEAEDSEETPGAGTLDCTADGIDEVTLPLGETTLHFFSEDADGNREVLRTAVYAVDPVPPVTNVSLSEGLYGRDSVRPVELTCEDDRLEEFGCTTWYTLDGTELDTSSTVYLGPISLTALFPDRSIPPGEVDPLRHLAGTVTLWYFSVDGAGNREEPQRRDYEIDLAAPVVTPSLRSGNHVAPIEVALTCDDGLGSGCEAVYYTLDDTTPRLGAGGEPVGSTVRYDGTPIQIERAVILRTLAVDRAGNEALALTGAYALTNPEADARSGVGAFDLFSLLLGGGLAARRLRSRRHGGAGADCGSLT